MTDAQYRLLQRFADGERIFPQHLDDLDRSALRFLHESRYVTIPASAVLADWYYVITPRGREALSAENERRKASTDQQANQYAQQRAAYLQAIVDKKEQRRHDFKVAAFSVALTLLLEHVGGLVHFIVELFR
ncbi:MAG: hypothetical protein IJ418_00525 [Clostridia bacterium]|nr:hypothetical protein [Clostridia bacterium]